VDATIVRCLIVPAVMVRLGRANWWLPGWASRLVPRVGIEGDEFFKARDAASPAGSSPPSD
jgi:RND superfamily putative drug exporter